MVKQRAVRFEFFRSIANKHLLIILTVNCRLLKREASLQISIYLEPMNHTQNV